MTKPADAVGLLANAICWNIDAAHVAREHGDRVRSEHHRELVHQLCAQVRVLGARGERVARDAEMRMIES